MGDVLYYDDPDDVLDVILDLDKDLKTACLEMLSKHPDKGANFAFYSEDKGYGYIMKFVLEGSEGIIFLGSDNSEDIIDNLQVVHDNAPEWDKKNVEERINAAKYAFGLIKEKINSADVPRIDYPTDKLLP